MKTSFITAAIAITALLALTPAPDKPEPKPLLEDFGDLRGIPPHIEEIAQRLDQGFHVDSYDQQILSDYIEAETEAWNAWVASF
jgi:hypothetical protein